LAQASVESHPPEGTWQERAATVARGIRRRVLEHTIKNNGGYLSQACSAAEIMAALYVRIMRLGPVPRPLVPKPFPGVPGPGNRRSFTGAEFNGPAGPEWDRFVLSPAQYALVLYAALIETGRMAPEGLDAFNRDGGSVEMIGAEHSPGMEVTTGSLGQGLSQAAGIALARRLRREPGRVWVFMSDGEFQIGQTWETMQVLSHYRLDNLGIYVDVNKQQCDGTVKSVMGLDPLDQRLASFGARVAAVPGHDVAALAAPPEVPPDGRPLVVLCDTSPFRGIEILGANAPRFHYVRFRDAEERKKYEAALAAMR
jgi:transketolase